MSDKLRAKTQEDMAQEFYGVYMNDPGNNHLENKEWVLLVEARTKAKEILALIEPLIEEAKKQAHTKGIEWGRFQERERIHKSINEYYGRPEVEQGIIGFTQAVRQALGE